MIFSLVAALHFYVKAMEERGEVSLKDTEEEKLNDLRTYTMLSPYLASSCHTEDKSSR